MNLVQKTLLAHLKFLVLESAMMVSEEYNQEEIMANLLKAIEILESTEPNQRG